MKKGILFAAIIFLLVVSLIAYNLKTLEKNNPELLNKSFGESNDSKIIELSNNSSKTENEEDFQENSCKNNTNPIFTHHITDIEQIKNIATPPLIVSEDLKTHSYLDTEKKRVPVFAPIDMSLISGAFYKDGPYRLDFQVSCEITVRFTHITEPIDEIKSFFSSEPSEDSKDNMLGGRLNFKAGDLVGYTIGTPMAGNWDFGAYDSTSSNKYSLSEKWNNSWVYTTAVCPYDYFPQELREEYAKKFNLVKHTGAIYDGESFCK